MPVAAPGMDPAVALFPHFTLVVRVSGVICPFWRTIGVKWGA
jgi:hypothetical protein